MTGRLGMKLFVETEEFAKLNVGFVLDEGLANPEDCYTVYYGERAPWCMYMTRNFQRDFIVVFTGNRDDKCRIFE